MKRLKTILGLMIVVLLTVLCLILLVTIYNEEGTFEFFKDTTQVFEYGEGFDVVYESEKLDSYIINREDMSYIELSINNNYIRFENEAIWIKEQLMIQGSQINRNFAVYNDCMLVIPFNYKYKPYGGIIIYNLYLDEYVVYEELDGMYIDIRDYEQVVYFSESGISLDLTIVDGKYVLDGDKKKSICDYKKKPLKYAKKSIIYVYDENSKEFKDMEIISTLDFKHYISSNNYCKN